MCGSHSYQESIEIALIENIQRETLNPLEIAIDYKRLMDECELTQDKLSERLGKLQHGDQFHPSAQTAT
jgi:ParB/RepB/Spo0J family partition protein